MDETGWYAEEDADAPVAGSPWRATLQLPGFVVPTEGPWFETEAACLEFIRDDILGKGLFPPRPGPSPR